MYTDRMTPTQELVDRGLYGGGTGGRYFLAPWNYPDYTVDTVLGEMGYHENLTHLKLICTNRNVPRGVEVLVYPRIKGDAIMIGFAELDGTTPVEISVDSRRVEGDVVTFTFYPPED